MFDYPRVLIAFEPCFGAIQPPIWADMLIFFIDNRMEYNECNGDIFFTNNNIP